MNPQGKDTEPVVLIRSSLGRKRWLSRLRRGLAAVPCAALVAASAPLAAQPAPPAPLGFGGPSRHHVPVRPGGLALPQLPVPSPPGALGRTRCLPVEDVTAAQLHGDRTLLLSMRDGRRWQMILAETCPALAFYQGFYFRQSVAGQICASRDAISARSGGECGIAAILPAGRDPRKPPSVP